MIGGIDASMDCTPYINQIRAQGATFVGRYYTNLERTRFPSKLLSAREAHNLCDAGFSLAILWELSATVGYFSASQGQDDAKYAYRYAKEIIRQPENSAIYFCVDFDAAEIQFADSVLPYFEGIARGFANVSNQPIYSVGVYGSGAVCAALKQAGLVRFTWLSQSLKWQGSENYQDWDIKQEPEMLDHMPFRFDGDTAKEQFGAFRIDYQNKTDFFALGSSESRNVRSPAAKTTVRAKGKKTKQGV
jgi:Domain of unknown function (DUF1906)